MSFSRDLYIKKANEEGYSDSEIETGLAYANDLIEKSLPVIFNREHLAAMIGMETKYLTHIINNRGRFYGYFRLEKRNGGNPREIMAPKDDLKYIQRWINTYILNKLPLADECKGFRKGYSIKDNALVHDSAPILLKIDLLKFFDTIKEYDVYRLFHSFGYSKSLSWDLTKLTTGKHRKLYWEGVRKENKELESLSLTKPAILPQGAPTSPTISNLVATNLDKKLKAFSESNGFRYSRYADDLAFSSPYKIVPNVSTIQMIIENEGFYVNRSKIKILKRGTKQYLTGLTITHGVHVSKKYRKEIYTHLYYAKTFGVQQHLKNLANKKKIRQNIYSYQDWLFGRIAFVFSINKEIGKDMMDKYNMLDWTLI